uniref:Glycosyl hydrolases family 22 (GH22) domain-containing protein n=2 Tax=Pyxicephalus adspersus TaxID=30357 RepID=A0AAV3A726_PYXAD|nr:TPA: hypothetical protein GDO54_013311 [Pyxicephalus adspersus]
MDTSQHFSSTEYGMLQINSFWWCDDKETKGRKNLCGVLCEDLLDDDITDDLLCLKRIVKDPKGLKAWIPWTENCEGKDLSQYTKGCSCN